MKRIVLALLLAMVISCVPAQADYIVDGRELTDMSIEELYDLEDTLIDALHAVFAKTSHESENGELVGMYVINPKTGKFHYPECYSAIQIGNKRMFCMSTASELVADGYTPCGMCRPYLDE